MHALQLPQCALCGGVTGSGRSVKISPRKNHEPASRVSSSVCLPCQPIPTAAASATSSTGALSVNTRYPKSPTDARMRVASRCSLARSTLW